MKHSDSTLKEDQTFPGWIWLHSGLFLAAMQMDFNYDLVNLAIPLLAISFGASSLQLGLLGALQRMLYIFVCPVSGRLSDRLRGSERGGIRARVYRGMIRSLSIRRGI